MVQIQICKRKEIRKRKQNIARTMKRQMLYNQVTDTFSPSSALTFAFIVVITTFFL